MKKDSKLKSVFDSMFTTDEESDRNFPPVPEAPDELLAKTRQVTLKTVDCEIARHMDPATIRRMMIKKRVKNWFLSLFLGKNRK